MPFLHYLLFPAWRFGPRFCNFFKFKNNASNEIIVNTSDQPEFNEKSVVIRLNLNRRKLENDPTLILVDKPDETPICGAQN